jgi:hypothetical protein
MWVGMDIASTPTVSRPEARAPAVDSVWGRDGFGFDDLLDVVNPLQHLPGVAQIYRHLTGDDIGMLPAIAGGLLFGGPVGAATSIVSAGVEAGTGKSPAASALAALQGDAARPAPAPSVPRVVAAYATPATATPHADRPAPATAAAADAARPAAWAPPLSGASARLLAELERAATTTG